MAEFSEVEVMTVTTTVAAMEDARRLAGALLDSRLAACVQLEPIAVSMYRWEGKLCEDPEVRLVIKTRPSRMRDIEAFFADHHPYDVPQFVATLSAASEAYGEWVRAETG